MSICEYCGAEGMDHDYQHLARECYPAQIKAKDAEIERLRAALEEILATNGDGGDCRGIAAYVLPDAKK